MAERAKIFLVDEHPIEIWGLTALINQQPDLMVCGQADDHPQALSGIVNTRPDLAVVDLSLKHSSGLELIKDLRSQQPQVRVVVITISAELDYVRRALHAGVRGYVQKHEATDVFIAAVRAVLAGRRYLTQTLAMQLIVAGLDAEPAHEVVLKKFSDRERDIYDRFAGGVTVREIASALRLSPKTVHTHCDRMKLKVGVRTERELQLLAVRMKTQQHPSRPTGAV